MLTDTSTLGNPRWFTDRPVRLEMPRLGGRRLEVVVASVDIADGSVGELRRIDIVQRAEIDRIEGAAFRMPERAYPAGSAEAMMDAPGAELVICQLGIAGNQAHIGRADRREP